MTSAEVRQSNWPDDEARAADRRSLNEVGDQIGELSGHLLHGGGYDHGVAVESLLQRFQHGRHSVAGLAGSSRQQ
ncbi:MAG: hypothetical protein SXG53_18125 [Pseudomonadota bacterium]|nr:hypothetical protein [Pseudomonadota bacterium]